MTSSPTAVAEGLFEVVDGRLHLLGSRCSGCATCYFPQTLRCRNPACGNKSLRVVQLPTSGTLVSYTVQRYRPPPLFRKDDWQPYAIGLVDLGGGLEVMGMLHGVPLEAITIGMGVELIPASLFVAQDGGEVVTYAFAPRGAA